MIVFSKEEWDYVGFSLLAAIIGVFVTFIYVKDMQILEFIDFEPILFILSMQMIVAICEQHKFFQWVALKTLYITKGNHRAFFSLICIIGGKEK